MYTGGGGPGRAVSCRYIGATVGKCILGKSDGGNLNIGIGISLWNDGAIHTFPLHLLRFE